MDFIPDISSHGNHLLQETMTTEESTIYGVSRYGGTPFMLY